LTLFVRSLLHDLELGPALVRAVRHPMSVATACAACTACTACAACALPWPTTLKGVGEQKLKIHMYEIDLRRTALILIKEQPGKASHFAGIDLLNPVDEGRQKWKLARQLHLAVGKKLDSRGPLIE
jgi:hypothetical protein